MEIKEKKFDDRLLKLYSEIKEKCNKEFTDLTIVNNVYLIFQKLFENKDKKGTYVECGVFMGGTLMSAVNFAKDIDIDFNFIGADTFSGFPLTFQHNENDLPSKFIELYNSKLISEDHFNKIKKRTNNFIDISHLETKYFNNEFDSLFRFCDKKGVSLLKGKFENSLVDFDKEIREHNQNKSVINGDVFLHRSRVPLDQVEFKRRKKTKEDDYSGDDYQYGFGNECEGLCGV